MSNDFHTDQAVQQLDRILGFFNRVESKASLLFAADGGLLALLALNVRLSDFQIWYVVLPGFISTLLIIASLYFLYQCAVPNLKGGAGSLIYFSEISARTEARFIDEFMGQTKSDFTRDVLGQVWRNSEILRVKFQSVKYAFLCTAAALFPWCLFIGAVSILHFEIKLS